MSEINISNAKYITDIDGNNSTIQATIDAVEKWVPIAPGNRHYDEIMKQVAAGDLTIVDAD